MVPEAGIEPARYCYHKILSLARLPIPPLRHISRTITIITYHIVQCNMSFKKSIERGILLLTKDREYDLMLFDLDGIHNIEAVQQEKGRFISILFF